MTRCSDITVCIATIPPRAKLLRRALSSVTIQALQPDAIVVEYDHDHDGAVITKNRALAKVKTKYAAWLDDDDFFHPDHLMLLRPAVMLNDVAYSWPMMDGAADPVPQHFGVDFDADALRDHPYVHTTCLFDAAMARDVGGFQHAEELPYDDWGLWLRMLNAGAKFVHVAARTWTWTVRGQNTSGDGTRW